MKVSVSLPEEDVEFLDAYASQHGHASRSAVLHRAVALLRTAGLSQEYADAWDEWDTNADASAWDSVVADGLTR